jgi:hypothetical protein
VRDNEPEESLVAKNIAVKRNDRTGTRFRTKERKFETFLAYIGFDTIGSTLIWRFIGLIIADLWRNFHAEAASTLSLYRNNFATRRLIERN